MVFQPTDDPNWLENSSAGVAWKDAKLHIHYATALEESNPEAAAVLSKMSLTTDQVSSFVFKAVVDKMGLEDIAREFVDNNQAVIDEWLR